MRSMYPELNAFVAEIADDPRYGAKVAGMVASAIEGAEEVIDDKMKCACQRDAWFTILDIQRRIAKSPAPLSQRVDAWCEMVDRYMPERDN